jgi:hypothetical protein
MSTFAPAIKPPSLPRLLVQRHVEVGVSSEPIEQRLRELRTEYLRTPAVTYREATFRSLAQEWRDATKFQSLLKNSTSHPTYRAIVHLGDEIVPLLLQELERRPEPWFAALREITGADPVTPAERGKMQAMADAWLRWGRGRGLIR